MTQRSIQLLLAGASTTALSLALGLSGAQAQEAVDLTPIVVEAGAPDPTAPVEGFVATSSATLKGSAPLAETPRSVTVVTRDQITAQGAQNLAEALSYAAGTVSEPYGADPRFDSVVVRGTDLQNQAYLNGLRVQRSTRPDYGAPALDLYGMERVELLRGPASVLYGAGSPSGLINLVQKRAQLGESFAEAGLSFDSNGSAHVFGDVNTVVSDRLAYRVTAKAGNQKLAIDEYDNPGGYLGLALTWQATDATTVEVLASVQKDDPDSPAGVPNELVGVYPDADLRDFYFGNEALEHGDRQTLNLGFQISHAFDNGWTLVNNTRFSAFDWSYNNVSVGAVTGTEVARTVLDQDESATSLATDLRLTGSLQSGAVTHDVTFGVDARRFSEESTSVFYFGQEPIDYASPDYSDETLDTSSPFAAATDVTVTQLGLYAADEMSFGNWRGSLALRHDWNRSEGDADNYGTPVDLDRDDSATTGQAGIAHVWDNGLTGYLSYATSFSVSARPDDGGNVLEPTTGKQWEAGLKYQPAGLDAFFTAALYNLREENRATTTTVGGVPFYDQIGKSEINGLELEGRGSLGNGWTLAGGYSWTESRIIGGDLDGNELANTPEQTAKLWLSKEVQVGALKGLTIGAGARYIGERYAFNANTNRLDDVTLFDAGLSYDWNGAAVQLNVTNLTDEVYVSSVGSFSTYYGDGRTVSAQLTYEW
ncbi:MAG: TonB-dependent siderophore receptor [Rhodobacteraceae bacterium]|nr:TonB-dependent siderophore receptor [Paracoccaceae bacterium]MBR9823514.1 TonB-dependent siderophore receptor [Paracoccaceae bacterium]